MTFVAFNSIFSDFGSDGVLQGSHRQIDKLRISYLEQALAVCAPYKNPMKTRCQKEHGNPEGIDLRSNAPQPLLCCDILCYMFKQMVRATLGSPKGGPMLCPQLDVCKHGSRQWYNFVEELDRGESNLPQICAYCALAGLVGR